MSQLTWIHASKRLSVFSVLFAFTFGMWLIPMEVNAKEKDTLWLSVSPAAVASDPDCKLHGALPVKKSKVVGKPEGVHGGKSQEPQRFESEHRSTPVRTYYLNGPTLSTEAEAYVLHPDGSSKQLKVKYAPQASITLKTPLDDERTHGANNIYVIDKQVDDGVLTIQSAKWLVINHNCSWGHDYRNDNNRKTAHALAQVPLEIVIDGLWDANFHADAKSGENLDILVTSEGIPVKGAKVTVTTEKGWTKLSRTGADGIAKVQLIRDYYPKGWGNFKRNQQGSFTVKAEYCKDEVGQYNDQPYAQVHYIATFPWKYSPARADYQSYAFGLGLGAFSMCFAGIGIYSFRERRKRPYQVIDLE